jgi:hypothetical protein
MYRLLADGLNYTEKEKLPVMEIGMSYMAERQHPVKNPREPESRIRPGKC